MNVFKLLSRDPSPNFDLLYVIQVQVAIWLTPSRGPGSALCEVREYGNELGGYKDGMILASCGYFVIVWAHWHFGGARMG